MFCPHCGQQNIANAIFCNFCGKNITVYPVPNFRNDFQLQKQTIRQSELQKLNDTYNYFAPERDTFAEYDRVCKRLAHYSKGASRALLIWGCIILSIGIVGMLANFGGNNQEGLYHLLLAFALLSIGIGMVVGGVSSIIDHNKKCAYYQHKYCQISHKLFTHYYNYPNCPVGPEYATPDILERLIEIINSGRADTIKESLNLFVQDIDMGDLKRHLSSIEQNTANLNRRLGITTFFVSTDFFTKR